MAMKVQRNTRLFGLPYQFRAQVDPRIKDISTTLGRTYAENIILDAPTITIIPGKPHFLPTLKKGAVRAKKDILLASANEDGGVFKAYLNKNKNTKAFRYYDFERSYTEYMKYVNILCRTCAVFLEIGETFDVNGKKVSAQSYDWRNWKWNTNSYLGSSATSKSLALAKKSAKKVLSKYLDNFFYDNSKDYKLDTSTTATAKKGKFLYKTTTSDDDSGGINVEELLSNYSYVQFYVDVNSGSQESLSNQTTTSKMKSMFDGGSDMLKELAFITNSGGIDTSGFADFADASMSALADNLSGFGSVTGALSRILNLSSNVIKGENVIMPDIYQSSSYEKSYSFTVHLKTPYGTRYGFFIDICVPLMHLLALGLPKQTSGNTYGAPFLVKCFQEGAFSCNMGIVTSISVNKGEYWSADGYPTEVDVTLSIADLYSDLTMSPQSDPFLFINNTSLIDYLGVTCGLSAGAPNLTKKKNMIVNTITKSFTDIPSSISANVEDAMNKFVMSFTGLNI